MKQKWVDAFMDTAERFAQLSSAKHSDDTVSLVTKDEVIHAEANAISKLAKSGDSGDGASLFCTHAPCIHCAKIIYGAGISKVYYRDTYRDSIGLDFLEKCNIEIERVICQ